MDHVSRAGVIVSAAAGTLLLAGVLAGRDGERRTPCPGSLVPAYLYPDELLRLTERSPLPRMIVVNPANGAGPAADPDYRRAIGAVQARGVRVLGYVPTTWGARSLEASVAESDRYRRWYGVDGIFADEAASDPRELPYYRTLSRQARAAGAGLVVLNPGAVPDPGYFDIADVIVTYEGSAGDYEPAAQPSWPERARTAHLVYGATREQALAALRPGAPAGFFYATSGSLPHPWGTVPDYLDAELAALGGCR